MRIQFILLGLLLTSLAYGQDFRKLVRKADSLKYFKKNDEAIKYYDMAIDSVLYGKQKENISDDEWFEILNSANEIGRHYRYGNLAYGTRAEKLSEKVAELHDMAVKYIFSFEVNPMYDAVHRGFLNRCSGGNKHMLVWMINDHIFLQAFDACNTYKTLKIENSAAVGLLKTSYADIVKDQVQKLEYNQLPSRTDYRYTYYINGQPIKTDWVNFTFFTDRKGRFTTEALKKSPFFKKEAELLNKNVSTKFCSLFFQMLNCEKEYNQRIDSGAERATVGKL